MTIEASSVLGVPAGTCEGTKILLTVGQLTLTVTGSVATRVLPFISDAVNTAVSGTIALDAKIIQSRPVLGGTISTLPELILQTTVCPVGITDVTLILVSSPGIKSTEVVDRVKACSRTVTCATLLVAVSVEVDTTT